VGSVVVVVKRTFVPLLKSFVNVSRRPLDDDAVGGSLECGDGAARGDRELHRRASPQVVDEHGHRVAARQRQVFTASLLRCDVLKQRVDDAVDGLHRAHDGAWLAVDTEPHLHVPVRDSFFARLPGQRAAA
jgi:hypothetical protein